VLERVRRLGEGILRGESRHPFRPIALDECGGVGGGDQVSGYPVAGLDHPGEIRLEGHVGSGEDIAEQVIRAEVAGGVGPGCPGAHTDLVDIPQVPGLVLTNAVHLSSLGHRPAPVKVNCH